MKEVFVCRHEKEEKKQIRKMRGGVKTCEGGVSIFATACFKLREG